MNDVSRKTKSIALCGLATALAVMFTVLGSIIPGAEMTCYAVAGLFSGIVIMEVGLRGGILVYVAVLLLSFIFVPNKLAILPYGMFFGIYAFIKFFAEKLKKSLTQICAKAFFFVAESIIIIYFFKELFLGNSKIYDFPIWAIVLIVVIAFFVYDYIFTLAVNLYRKRIKRETVDFRLSYNDEEKPKTDDEAESREDKNDSQQKDNG